MPPSSFEYYIDEAGSATLWQRRGGLIVGTEGCSRYFAMGLAKISNSNALDNDLQDLRRELLSDPYFQGVPSMSPRAGKTALFFHAKDDLPEVRREVFRVLERHNIEYHAVVRDKMEAARIVDEYQVIMSTYRYKEEHLYDSLAKRLLRDKLHSADGCPVIFSKRGKRNLSVALGQALQKASDDWCDSNGISHCANPVSITAGDSRSFCGLQAADYFLWALQRCYEKGEDRFIRMIWGQVGCVWDCDDKRKGITGMHYTKEQPLTAAELPEI